MNRQAILIVEDEEDITELVGYHLSRAGFQAIRSASGEEGLRLAREKRPALVLLDLMLPGMDGLDVCKALRSDPATRETAIVMLTAKGEEADIVVGLEMGADDYVTKPFSPRVLVSRVKAVLRRRASPPAESDADVLRVHDLAIHPGRREVLHKNKPIELTSTEFNILRLLARRPGWVFTRNQILDAARGGDALATDRAVDVQIVGLRRKLGPAARYIETVRGVGYRMKE
ncbi:MAG: response regulator transcription factor [Planctomycetota bacterium]